MMVRKVVIYNNIALQFNIVINNFEKKKPFEVSFKGQNVKTIFIYILFYLFKNIYNGV